MTTRTCLMFVVIQQEKDWRPNLMLHGTRWERQSWSKLICCCTDSLSRTLGGWSPVSAGLSGRSLCVAKKILTFVNRLLHYNAKPESHESFSHLSIIRRTSSVYQSWWVWPATWSVVDICKVSVKFDGPFSTSFNIQTYFSTIGITTWIVTSESLKDLMCLGTTWYQLESCRGHGSYLTLYYDCKTC